MDATPIRTPTDSIGTATIKRKRSPSPDAPSATPAAPAAKAAKTNAQMSINYLARQSVEDLPLITKDDTLQNMLHLLSAYSNILDRHESLASNLGARPLGPILIKRFERCFESPPKVVASHSKNATTEDSTHQITWLEVIEFARSHPTQFTLDTFSEGRRVCQFYYPQRQLRVQISEEDYLFINSGRCQELIPPLPIWEDEEKEVGTCDVLEAKLKDVTNAADMVAARTRQLSHRLKGRRAAILERRAEGGSGSLAKANAIFTTTAPSTNPGPPQLTATSPLTTTTHAGGDSPSGTLGVSTASTNGRPLAVEATEPTRILGSSATVRNELLRHFESLPHNQGHGRVRHVIAGAGDHHHHRQGGDAHTSHDGAASNASSLSPAPYSLYANEALPYSTPNAVGPARTYSSIPPAHNVSHRPSSSTGGNLYSGSGHPPSKHNFSRPLPPALESTQPFRPLCQAHMDGLPRGERVIPPCDRCRRLRMDCIKNLTSCAGCTRKHARCHWRDVTRDELGALGDLMDSVYSDLPSHANDYPNGGNADMDEESDDDESNPLEDLEALGDIEEQENQIREDEEGLRNARELAVKGWEGGSRTEKAEKAEWDAKAQGLVNGVAGSFSHHQPDVDELVEDTVEPVKLDEYVGGESSVGPKPSLAADHDSVDGSVLDNGVLPESYSNDIKSAQHGGFQAVNGSVL